MNKTESLSSLRLHFSAEKQINFSIISSVAGTIGPICPKLGHQNMIPELSSEKQRSRRQGKL